MTADQRNELLTNELDSLNDTIIFLAGMLEDVRDELRRLNPHGKEVNSNETDRE